MFEMVYAAEAFRAANDLERRSREKYKNSSNPAPAHYQQQQQNHPPIPNQQHQAPSFNTTEVVNKLRIASNALGHGETGVIARHYLKEGETHYSYYLLTIFLVL